MLTQLETITHLAVGLHQYNRAIALGQSGDQALRLNRTNLLGWEVDHADDLLTHQSVGLIEIGNLRTRFQNT